MVIQTATLTDIPALTLDQDRAAVGTHIIEATDGEETVVVVDEAVGIDEEDILLITNTHLLLAVTPLNRHIHHRTWALTSSIQWHSAIVMSVLSYHLEAQPVIPRTRNYEDGYDDYFEVEKSY